MDLIYQVNNLIKTFLKPIHAQGYYSVIMFTHQFDALFDYDAGILELNVLYDYTYGKNEQICITISTVDDGVWQGYRNNCLTKDESEKLIKDILDEFGNKLPTEEKFNQFLFTYGIYGLFTG